MVDTDSRRLTPKGRATRERIVRAAAGLIHQHGVAGTSIDDVRTLAGVSGSQMTHYFLDKRSLVRAVVVWQADAAIALHRLPELRALDSFEAIDLWAELHIARQKQAHCVGGCMFGSLAGELAETDIATREELAAGFERWESLFRHGLRLMKKRGELRSDANTDDLAAGLLAALQGGMLIAKARHEIRPVEAALKNMIAHLRSFATDEAERGNTRRKPALSRKAAQLVGG